MTKLALGMIVKDEVAELDSILSSYKAYFDEIQITITNESKRKELEQVCAEHGATATYFDWINDFSAARNFNLSQCKSDYVFRMDADDTLVGEQNIRRVLEKVEKNEYTVVYCYYLYSRDEFGSVNAAHWRETLIRNDGNLFWNKSIHENLIPKNPAELRPYMEDSIKIEHHPKENHTSESAVRNIQYLLEEYNRDKEKTDPRTLAYLGRMFFSAGDFDKAIFFLEKHIQSSGWDEDRYCSWTYLAESFKQKGNHKQAIAAANEALNERPDYPDAYLKLHDIYFDLRDYHKAVEFGKLGLSKPIPKTFMLLDPSSYGWRPTLSMAFSFLQINDIDNAKKFFDLVRKQVPNLPWVKENASLFDTAHSHKTFLEKFMWVYNFVKNSDKKKVTKLLDAIPDELADCDTFNMLKMRHARPKVWADNSIVIFCCATPEEWDDRSVEKGIGGSEEAVIYMSRVWAKMGYSVTVFNTCGRGAGVYNGVTYKRTTEFNPRDTFNILISWRSNVFTFAQAKKRIIWFHDVPRDQMEFVGGEYDKLAVLSNFHRTLFSSVPDSQIFVTSNGVNPEDFKAEEVRNPKRIIYASSYDRGLEKLLDMWSYVIAEVPDAELHVYYGWNSFDNMTAMMNINGESFKSNIEKKMQQRGIFHHGRVGHKELIREYKKSGIFAYPCVFEEINCIALTKALGSGCFALTSDYAAVGERNTEGVCVKQDEFCEALITSLKGSAEAKHNVEEYLSQNSWEKVAHDWVEMFATVGNELQNVLHRIEWVKSNCVEGESIVDIGGNDGHTFEDWDRETITTVDLDLYDIQNFVRGNAEDLPFKDGEFQTAVLGEILEHVENPIQALKEARRVARKNVIITVPYEQEWPEEYEPMMGVSDKEAKHHVSRLELAKEASPLCKEFYTEDNYEHLWHRRHYDKQSLDEHLKLAGYSNYDIKKLQSGKWVFWGVIETIG